MRFRISPVNFLIVSALSIAVILMGFVVSGERVRQEEIEKIKEQNEYLIDRMQEELQKYREAQEKLRIQEERLRELEETLFNLERTYQTVAMIDIRGASLSRSGASFSSALSMRITQPSGFSPSRFEKAFRGTNLAGIGFILVSAEKQYGINALVMAGIIVHETGWGTSRLVRERNNLAGLGASGPGRGMDFDDRAGSVNFLAELLATKYCPGGKFFGGSHDLAGIGERYAEDPGWARKVAGCMKIIAERSVER